MELHKFLLHTFITNNLQVIQVFSKRLLLLLYSSSHGQPTELISTSGKLNTSAFSSPELTISNQTQICACLRSSKNKNEHIKLILSASTGFIFRLGRTFL